MYGQSPHSSSGIFGSSEGTPDTRFTAFSPDDARPLKASNQDSDAAHSGATHQDPFVTITARGRSEQKLSATASAFKPFNLPVATTGPATELGFTATAALPGQIKKLNNLIDLCKPGNGSKYGNVTQSAPIYGSQQGGANQQGTFTTDTVTTRCIQITNVYNPGSTDPKTVINSLDVCIPRLHENNAADYFSRCSRPATSLREVSALSLVLLPLICATQTSMMLPRRTRLSR